VRIYTPRPPNAGAKKSELVFRVGFDQQVEWSIAVKLMTGHDYPCLRLNIACMTVYQARPLLYLLHPLQLTDQVAQSVVLPGQLIALLDEPRRLGPLGVALGPRRQHQRTQRGDVVTQDLWARHARIIALRRNPRIGSTYG
jgi:hypothetical protein